MDAAKRRALIKTQVARRKESGEVVPKGTSSSNPSTKRKQLPKGAVLLRSPNSLWNPLWG